MNEFKIVPIGHIRKTESDHYLEILPDYFSGLYRLDLLSHIFVLWWIHETDQNDLRKVKTNVLPRVVESIHPPQEMGTFATRSPHRPNPIGLTLVKILSIASNKVYVDFIDAFDNTPIIDIKPYLPNGDRVDEVHLPKWFLHLKDSASS
ncbi:MAG: tRNA (N6-threonylcarbamoyladenosine(37)-N6)-methyltransferase TrmO [Candidatus Hodarchaeales archaeon]